MICPGRFSIGAALLRRSVRYFIIFITFTVPSPICRRMMLMPFTADPELHSRCVVYVFLNGCLASGSVDACSGLVCSAFAQASVFVDSLYGEFAAGAFGWLEACVCRYAYHLVVGVSYHVAYSICRLVPAQRAACRVVSHVGRSAHGLHQLARVPSVSASCYGLVCVCGSLLVGKCSLACARNLLSGVAVSIFIFGASVAQVTGLPSASMLLYSANRAGMAPMLFQPSGFMPI